MAQIIDLRDNLPAAPDGFQNGTWQKGAQTGTDAATGLPIYPASVNTPSTGSVAVKTADYTLQAADCGKLIVVNSASAVVITLPAAVPFAKWNCIVASIGAGAVTISPGTLLLDGSSSSVALAPGQSCYLATDGTNYFSGRGGAGGSTTSPAVGFIIGIGTAGTNVGPMLPALRSGSFTKCVVVVKASDGTTGLTFRIKQNGTDVFSADPTVAAGTAAGTELTFTTLTGGAVTALDVFSIDITSGTANWSFTAVLM